MRFEISALITCLTASFAPAALADIYLTPMVGYTYGGQVEDSNGTGYDVNASALLALAAEFPFENGRIGLFYSQQETDVEVVGKDTALRNLQFQSSVHYPGDNKFSSFFGLGLGVSHADADWVDQKYGFSASIFAGLEYRFISNLRLNTQLRWLGMSVDNDPATVCASPGASQCGLHFKSDWINQISANIGLTLYF